MTKPTLLYIYDPLCGWCYGFAPVMQQLQAHFASVLRFDVLAGGLAVGERAAPISQAYNYIQEALQLVEQRTGVTFGEAFKTGILADGSYYYDSLPPSIALAVTQERYPSYAMAFAHAIQARFFYNGESLNDEATYTRLLGEWGLAPGAFSEGFHDPAFRQRAEAGFQRAQQLGAMGFPTLLLMQPDGQLQPIARGYAPYDQVADALRGLLAGAAPAE